MNEYKRAYISGFKTIKSGLGIKSSETIEILREVNDLSSSTIEKILYEKKGNPTFLSIHQMYVFINFSLGLSIIPEDIRMSVDEFFEKAKSKGLLYKKQK